MVFSFLMQCHKRKLKAVQGRKMEKIEDRTKKHDIKNQNEERHNRSLKYMKKKINRKQRPENNNRIIYKNKRCRDQDSIRFEDQIDQGKKLLSDYSHD